MPVGRVEPLAFPPSDDKGNGLEGVSRSNQFAAAFDHVLKRSPRLILAPSSRITSGVRRIIRTVLP